MPAFENENQLYSCLDELFSRMSVDDEAAGAALHRAGLSFRFRCINPEAEVLIDGRQTPLNIQFGSSRAKVDLEITLQTDALHQILQGDLSLTKAIGRRLVVPKGPVWKAKQLSEIFSQAQKLYPGIYISTVNG